MNLAANKSLGEQTGVTLDAIDVIIRGLKEWYRIQNQNFKIPINAIGTCRLLDPNFEFFITVIQKFKIITFLELIIENQFFETDIIGNPNLPCSRPYYLVYSSLGGHFSD